VIRFKIRLQAAFDINTQFVLCLKIVAKTFQKAVLITRLQIVIILSDTYSDIIW